MKKKLRHELKFILSLFFFSFILQTLFFVFFLQKNKRYLVCHDSGEYYYVAVQIVQGNEISNQDGNPTFFRVPGYSIFLSFFYRIFGFDLEKALWGQIFLASFIPILVFCLSLILFFKNILLAKISGIFFMINVGHILHSGLLMSDSLCLIFFLLFSILFFSSFDLFFCTLSKRFCLTKLFFSGVLLGVVSLIRPVGHFILLICVLLLFLSKFSFIEKLKANLLFLMGWLSVVFWWLLRNFLLTGFVFFHAMPGIHFLQYFAAEVLSQAQGCSYAGAKAKLLKEYEEKIIKRERKREDKINELEKCNIAQNIATKYLKQNLFLTFRHAVINIFKTLFSLNSAYLLFLYSNSWPNYWPYTSFIDKLNRFLFPQTKNKLLDFIIYFEIFCLAVVLLGFLGTLFIALFNRELLCVVLKILPVIGLMLLLTFGSGVARLRLPVEPFLIIFASNFWLNLFEKKRFIGVRKMEAI